MGGDRPSLDDVASEPELLPLPSPIHTCQAAIPPKLIMPGELVSRDIIADARTRQVAEVVSR